MVLNILKLRKSNERFKSNRAWLVSSHSISFDFGDAGSSISNSSGCSDCVRVAFAHGNNPSTTDTIEYINISTGGDAVDFGNLSQSRDHLGGCSNGHGGLG